MKGDDFYEEFKWALKAVGSSWPGEDVEVTVRGTAIVFTKGDSLYALNMKPKQKTPPIKVEELK